MEEILRNLEIGSRQLAREFLTKPYRLNIKGFVAREFEHLILVQIILPLKQKKSFWEVIKGRVSKWAEGEFVIYKIFIVIKEYFNKLPDFNKTIQGISSRPPRSLSKVDALFIELDNKLAFLGSTIKTVSNLFQQGNCLL